MADEDKKNKGCGCGVGCVMIFGLLWLIGSIMSCVEKKKDNTFDDERVEIRDSGKLNSFLKITFGESFKDEKWKDKFTKEDYVSNPDGGSSHVFKCLVTEVGLEKALFPISGFDTARVYAGIDEQKIFMIELKHRESGGDKKYGITGNPHTDEYRNAFKEMMKAKYGLKDKECRHGDEYRHKNVLVRFESYLQDVGLSIAPQGYYTHYITVSATNLDLARLAEQEAHNAKVREKKQKEEEAASRTKDAAKSGMDLL